ncbi:hypothetical protein IMSHALPRED_002000 [Imshaugia aleurites]|uniref:Uncharacterized protein n=1 Tax=Imshaugia aleurites TaxID=172621 RepID=A0A8H3PGU8_9LECA|nr:hypothetical protein IMSHALPRED_002000 [Imshaugia aleurites]
MPSTILFRNPQPESHAPQEDEMRQTPAGQRPNAHKSSREHTSNVDSFNTNLSTHTRDENAPTASTDDEEAVGNRAKRNQTGSAPRAGRKSKIKQVLGRMMEWMGDDEDEGESRAKRNQTRRISPFNRPQNVKKPSEKKA